MWLLLQVSSVHQLFLIKTQLKKHLAYNFYRIEKNAIGFGFINQKSSVSRPVVALLTPPLSLSSPAFYGLLQPLSPTDLVKLCYNHFQTLLALPFNFHANKENSKRRLILDGSTEYAIDSCSVCSVEQPWGSAYAARWNPILIHF